MTRRPPRSTLFPYPPLFRSLQAVAVVEDDDAAVPAFDAAEDHRAVGRRAHLAAHAGGDVEAFVHHPLAGVRVEPHRSEEHTSELQSQSNLVCRLLLEKKKQ